MLCSGLGSSTTGRWNSTDSSWLTSGIRDEPPASTIERSSAGSTPAPRIARRSAAMVSSSAGVIIASNSDRLSRTRVCRLGSATGTMTSVS
jgi:hypothetical protein